jgi:hypothetical protein
MKDIKAKKLIFGLITNIILFLKELLALISMQKILRRLSPKRIRPTK